MSVAIVSSSLVEVMLGTPYPTWPCPDVNAKCVTGGVSIGGVFGGRCGNTIPNRCKINFTDLFIHKEIRISTLDMVDANML